MKSLIFKETKEHIPFTFTATVSAIILTTIVVYLFKSLQLTTSFEILHPLHIFISAIVTSAIFYKYKNKFIQALFIGIIGSILIGSISDIIFPFFGGNLLNLHTSFHLPLIESPTLIILTAISGSLIGIKIQITKIPHFIHVFLSVFASLFYLIAFSTEINFLYLLISTIIIFLAVLVPCCISDIIFPLLFIKKKINFKN